MLLFLLLLYLLIQPENSNSNSITVSSSSIRKYNVGLCGTVHEEISIAWAHRTTSIYSIGVTVR